MKSDEGTEGESALRYRKPLRRLRIADVKLLLSDALEEWYKHKAPRLGAAVAFYTVLSLAPLLVVVISVAGLVFGTQAAQGQIVGQIGELVGHEGAVAIQGLIEAARKPLASTLAAAIGVLMLTFSATGVIAELRDALNTIWEVPAAEVQGLKGVLSFARERVFSFAVVLGVGFLLLVSLVFNAWLMAMNDYVSDHIHIPGWTAEVFNIVLSVAMATAVFALVFRIMPDVELEWRDVTFGAFMTSLLFNIGKLLISLYIAKASVASAYGAAGSLVIILLWVYYSSLIFFLGAEFTQVFANRYGSQPTVRAHRALLGTLRSDSHRLQQSPTIIPP